MTSIPSISCHFAANVAVRNLVRETIIKIKVCKNIRPLDYDHCFITEITSVNFDFGFYHFVNCIFPRKIKQQRQKSKLARNRPVVYLEITLAEGEITHYIVSNSGDPSYKLLIEF